MIKAYNLVNNVPVLCDAADKKERGQESRVGEDFIAGMRISTVFIGLDTGDGNLFETMVFHVASMEWMDRVRYASWDAALRGHNHMVDSYKFSLDPMAEGTRRSQ